MIRKLIMVGLAVSMVGVLVSVPGLTQETYTKPQAHKADPKEGETTIIKGKKLELDTYSKQQHEDFILDLQKRDIPVLDNNENPVVEEDSYSSTAIDPEGKVFPKGTRITVKKILVARKGSGKMYYLSAAPKDKMVAVYRVQWVYVVSLSEEAQYVDYEESKYGMNLSPLYSKDQLIEGRDTVKDLGPMFP